VSLGREMLAITYEGKSLDRCIATSTTPSAVEDVKRKARRALAALHNHGVVHGDIALRNIVRDEATGSVKLIDLGSMYKPEDQSAFSSESAHLEQVLMELK
jgi:tRNA A-37 threonylcarbamoyl transferase component Bud32